MTTVFSVGQWDYKVMIFIVNNLHRRGAARLARMRYYNGSIGDPERSRGTPLLHISNW